MGLTISLVTPSAVEYDLTADTSIRYGVLPDSLPDLEQSVEDEACVFAAGELSLTCANEDGWWDTIFTGADRMANYPSTFTLTVARDSVTRWTGDIDLLSVSYDRKARTVQFTALGKLARLERHSAEGVRRACPEGVDWGESATVSSALTLESGENDSRAVAVDPLGEYAYVALLTAAGGGTPGGVTKVRLSDMARIGTLTFATGEDAVNDLAIDSTGTYLYAACYTAPVKIVKVRLSDFTRVSACTLESGYNYATGLSIDDDDAYMYCSCYVDPGRVAKVSMSTFGQVAGLEFSAGESNAVCCVVDHAGTNVYACTYESPGVVVKILASDMSRTGALTLAAGDNAPQACLIESGDDYLYVACQTTAGRIVEVTLSSFLRTDYVDLSAGEDSLLAMVLDIDEANLYVSTGTTAARVVKVTRSGLTRADAVTLSTGVDTAYGLAWDAVSSTLVVSTSTSAVKVARVATAGLLVQCSTVTDSGKAWTAGDLAGSCYVGIGASEDYVSHVDATDVITLASAHGWSTDQPVILVGGTFGGLTQGTRYYVHTPSGSTLKLATTRGGSAMALSATAEAGTAAFVGHVYTIIGNGVTSLVVAGTPPTTGYMIRPMAWATYVTYGSLPRKMTSLAQTVAELGIQVGDKLIITHTGGTPSRIVYSPKRGLYYVGTYESDQQSVAVKHIGPKSYPSLTAWEIGVDTDLESDTELGDHVINGTPYHRDKTVAELVGLLLDEAEVASADRVVDVPTLTNNVPTYADFDGQNVGDALKDMTKLVGCVLAETPEKIIFQRREVAVSDAGRGGSLDLIATKWAEQLIAEDSYDYVRVEGADSQVVARGATGFLSRRLELSVPWINDYAWLKQAADRNTEVFLGDRPSADVELLMGWGQNACADPSFEGAEALNGSRCQWKVQTAAGAGEHLGKSTSYASHLRQSLKVQTVGTAVQAKQLLFGSGAVTASSSTGLLLTFTNDFEAYTRVRFTTTGTLPTGLSTGIDYWTVRVGSTTCRVATSMDNAIAGTVVAYADAGTGTHTMTAQGITDLAAGETVTLSALAHLTSRTSGYLRVDLYGKNTAGSVVLTSTGVYWRRASAGFTPMTEAVLIPATVTHLWVRVHAASSPSFTGYVDEVRVERATKVLPSLLMSFTLGNEQYVAWSVREPLRSANSIMSVGLRGTRVSAISSEYDTTSDDSTPPQITVESLIMDGYETSPSTETTYTATLAWPYIMAPLAKVLITVWASTADRPDVPTSVQSLALADSDSLEVTFIVAANVATDSRYVDFVLLYADGRISVPSDPEMLPPSVP